MREAKIFPDRRACLVCGCEARALARSPIAGEPRILSISGTLYRKGEGKGAQQAAPAVRICEPCLVRALAGGFFGAGSAGRKLWAALRGSLAHAYNSINSEL